MKSRSEIMQKEYILNNGKVGEKISLSKKDSKNRYRIHKKLKDFVKIRPRKKEIIINPLVTIPEEKKALINELINKYGYFIQTELN